MGRPQFFTIDRTHQLAQGLVFAGLGNAPGSVLYPDSSPYGNHGALTNMNPTVDWKYNRDLQRSILATGVASNKYVQGTCEHFDHWSFAIWLNPLDDVRRGIVSKSLLGDSWGDMTIRRESSGVCLVYRGTSGTSIHSTGAVASGSFSHLVVTYNREYIRSYINGVFDTETAYTTAYGTTTQQLNIGAYYSVSSTNFRGAFADPLLYNRAFNPREIQQLADPSNYMLSGMIRPIGSESNIYDREGIR